MPHTLRRPSAALSRRAAVFLGLFVSSLVAMQSVCNGQVFDSRAYPVFPGSSHVEPADVDDDGRLDLLVSTRTGVVVLLGRGNGLFTRGMEIEISSGAHHTVARELSGDDHVDIVVMSIGGPIIWIYRGLGDGTFEYWVRMETGVAGKRGVAVGDLDNDGDNDFVVCHWRSNVVSTFLAHGNGLFMRTNWMVPTPYKAVLLAHMDSDQLLDLVGSDGERTMVRPGVGNGQFNALVHTYDGGTDVGGLAVGDLSEDGRPDVIVANAQGVFAHFGTGGGALGAAVHVDSHPFFSVTAADFDGDGHLDVAATTFDNVVNIGPSRLPVWRGDGTGALHQTWEGRAMARWVTHADVDADGLPDLVVCGNSETWQDLPRGMGAILLANPDGSFGGGRHSAIPCWSNRMAVGHVGADEHPDLVLQTEPHVLGVVHGLGDGRFGITETAPAGPCCPGASWEATGRSMSVGDVNADGRMDVVTSASGFLVPNRPPIFPPGAPPASHFSCDDVCTRVSGAVHAPVVTRVESGPRAHVLTDLNADARADLVVAADSVVVRLGNGDGTFRSPSARLPGFGLEPTADVNGDGYQDLVSFADSMTVRPGNGDGTFGNPIVSPVGGGRRRAFGDVDADGDLDLVALPGLQVSLGDGAGRFMPPTTSHDVPAGNFALTDVDGDGDLDVVVASASTVQMALVYAGNGNGTFEFEGHYAIEGALTFVRDLNGDRRADLLAISGCTAIVVLNSARTTAPILQRWVGVRSGDTVRLEWEFAATTVVTGWTGVLVERAPTMAGPYAALNERMLRPQRRMSFEDNAALVAETQWYRLALVSQDGSREYSVPLEPTLDRAPSKARLLAAERADGFVRIGYGVPRAAGRIELAVFDVRGRSLWRHEPSLRAAGAYEQTWDRRDHGGARVPRGIYIVRLAVDDATMTQKFILLAP
jgi:hypothetical protein